ncbi:MAG: proton-conducting transporter membrane subunit [Brumimicrobium sp.]|nr:proton-conducting transporter membrane subunit [Brumimicrobium sp.]
MDSQIVIYPILYHAFLAVILLFFWRKPQTQRGISIVGSAFGVIIGAYLFSTVWNSGIQTMQLGNWKPPFGITVVADTFSATLVLLTNIVAFAVSIYSTANVVSARVKFGYYGMFHFLIMGLTGAFLTGDIFNLYVWFEVIIISSFVLLTIGGKREQIEGAVKYFTLNMLASIVFLTAIAMLYGVTGSLNMAELSRIIPEIENKGLVQTISFVFFVGFAVKSGLFPLYFWLPASYHTPPAAVSSLFGGLLTKVGVYALIRTFTLLFPISSTNQYVFMWIAAFTIIFGGIGALVQKNMVRTFSYLIICHIGFMVGGLSLFTQTALIGAVFYMFHDIIVKANLFLIGGITFRIFGNNEFSKMGGLMNNYPKLSLLFLIPLFALIGIPPLSGFWPKISLFGASMETGNLIMTLMFIFASFITLLIIARIWNQVFSKYKSTEATLDKLKYFRQFTKMEKTALVLPVIILTGVTLYFSFFAEHMQILSDRISHELMNPSIYYEAVFNNLNDPSL